MQCSSKLLRGAWHDDAECAAQDTHSISMVVSERQFTRQEACSVPLRRSPAVLGGLCQPTTAMPWISISMLGSAKPGTVIAALPGEASPHISARISLRRVGYREAASDEG